MLSICVVLETWGRAVQLKLGLSLATKHALCPSDFWLVESMKGLKILKLIQGLHFLPGSCLMPYTDFQLVLRRTHWPPRQLTSRNMTSWSDASWLWAPCIVQGLTASAQHPAARPALPFPHPRGWCQCLDSTQQEHTLAGTWEQAQAAPSCFVWVFTQLNILSIYGTDGGAKEERTPALCMTWRKPAFLPRSPLLLKGFVRLCINVCVWERPCCQAARAAGSSHVGAEPFVMEERWGEFFQESGLSVIY